MIMKSKKGVMKMKVNATLEIKTKVSQKSGKDYKVLIVCFEDGTEKEILVDANFINIIYEQIMKNL